MNSSYAQDNALSVLKVPGALLRGRLRTPDRYCALSFDASSGAGWLFASYVELVGQQLGQQLDGGDGPARELAAQQLVDLLVCSVQADARVLSSSDWRCAPRTCAASRTTRAATWATAT